MHPSILSSVSCCSLLSMMQWHQLVSRMENDVTWRMVTSSTRWRERTSASVEDKMDKDWVIVSTSHSQTHCTSYSTHRPLHQLSNTNITSSSTWKVKDLSQKMDIYMYNQKLKIFYFFLILFLSFISLLLFYHCLNFLFLNTLSFLSCS